MGFVVNVMTSLNGHECELVQTQKSLVELLDGKIGRGSCNSAADTKAVEWMTGLCVPFDPKQRVHVPKSGDVLVNINEQRMYIVV